MSALKPASARRQAPHPAAMYSNGVSSLDARRIERALAGRARYKYVQPRLQREGLGWAVLSPNCSRNIDAHGGEIFIAWLVPTDDGSWLLHSREHAQDCWLLRRQGPLPQLLEALCADTQREYWV